MKVDRSNAAELLNWIWPRIDETTRKEAESWIAEQLDEGNIQELVIWSINQLGKDDKRKVTEWTFDPKDMSDSTLSRVTNSVLEDHYDNGKHRIDAWKAINLCLEADTPIPDWAKKYLLQVSFKILKIDTPGKRAAEKVYEAVGIPGHEFTQAHQQNRKKKLCLEVERLICEGRTKAAAYRVYAKEHDLKEAVVKGYHVEQRSNPAYWLWLGIDPTKSK